MAKKYKEIGLPMPIQEIKEGMYIYKAEGCGKRICNCNGGPFGHFIALAGQISKIEEGWIYYITKDEVLSGGKQGIGSGVPLSMPEAIRYTTPNRCGYICWRLEEERLENERTDLY